MKEYKSIQDLWSKIEAEISKLELQVANQKKEWSKLLQQKYRTDNEWNKMRKIEVSNLHLLNQQIFLTQALNDLYKIEIEVNK